MLTQELLLLLQRKLVENLPEQSDCWMSGCKLPFVNGILQRDENVLVMESFLIIRPTLHLC